MNCALADYFAFWLIFFYCKDGAKCWPTLNWASSNFESSSCFSFARKSWLCTNSPPIFMCRSYFEVEARSGRVLAKKGFASVPEDLLPFRLHLAARLALSLLSLQPLMHRLNMKLVYLRSFVQLYSMAETPQLPPPPAFGLIYEGAIGQPR